MTYQKNFSAHKNIDYFVPYRPILNLEVWFNNQDWSSRRRKMQAGAIYFPLQD